MKKLNIFLILIICFASNHYTKAQDPTFTQFYANPTYLNPALAGSNGCPRFNLNYRNQWPNLTSNYVTYLASYDQYIKSLSGGLGILATYDQQGMATYNTGMLALIYSYHLKLNRKWTMMFGVRAAMYNTSIDKSKLTFGDMIELRKGFVLPTQDLKDNGGSHSYFDASAGFVIYSKRFYGGFSAHHLNEPNQSVIQGGYSKLPIRYTAHLGTEIPLGNKSKFVNSTAILPNIIYQYQQGFQELCLGLYIKHNIFTTGIWLRNKDAFILSLGINTQKFKIGYSYDITINQLNNGSTYGSHEVSLGFYVPCKKKPVTFKTISCPSF